MRIFPTLLDPIRTNRGGLIDCIAWYIAVSALLKTDDLVTCGMLFKNHIITHYMPVKTQITIQRSRGTDLNYKYPDAEVTESNHCNRNQEVNHHYRHCVGTADILGKSAGVNSRIVA